MKLIKLTAVAASTLISLSAITSCSLTGSQSANDILIEYTPVQIEEDANWSFVNHNGEVILEDEFKNRPSAVVNGFFSVKENEGYTIYKFDEHKPAPLKDCEDLAYAGAFSDGLCPIVHKKQRIQIINEKGDVKFVLEPVKGKEVVYCETLFSDGMLNFRTENDEWGYFNTKGECVISPKYDRASMFIDGLAVVTTTKDDEDTYSVIDKKGTVVFNIKKGLTPLLNFARAFTDGHLFVSDSDDRYSYYDKKGELTKLPAKVKGITAAHKDLIVFQDNGQCGVMNLEGEILVRAKYEYIILMADGKMLAAKETKADILNSNGEVDFTIDDYKQVYYNPELGLVGRDKNSYTILDEEGNPIKNAEFYDISSRVSLSYGIYSDFFDLNGMAAEIASKISANGVGKYKLGEKPSVHLVGSPADNSYKTRFDLDDMNLKGYRWNASGTGSFNTSVTTWEWNPYTYEGVYSWNPESYLSNFTINVEAETDLGAPATKALAEKLKAKGFKIEVKPQKEDSDNSAYLLSNGKTIILFASSKDSQIMNIEMGRDEDGSALKFLKPRIQQLNGEDVPAAVEEAVVEEAVAVVDSVAPAM